MFDVAEGESRSIAHGGGNDVRYTKVAPWRNGFVEEMDLMKKSKSLS